MHRLRIAALIPVVALLVLAAPAAAHNVSAKPRFGETGDDFVFRGTFWQPSKRVRWLYDQRADGEFDDTGRFFVGTSGGFRFLWRNETNAGTHRMCFRQFDSRPRYERTFLKCRRFTVVPD